MSGRVVIVTGGSKGIGRAICLAFATLGDNVVINYNSNAQSALEVVTDCIQLGGHAIAVQGNIADESQAINIVNKTIETFGKVDILVNNAGITKDGLMMRMSDQDFSSVVDTNLKGTFYCMKAVSRPMMKQRSGRIINISSVVGISGNAGQINYSASKAGIIGMTKTAAKELASRNITVNAIAPGFIETDMTAVLSEDVVDKMKSVIPIARLGQPEDVAQTVVFLASNQSAYITGQVLSVDGGMSM